MNKGCNKCFYFPNCDKVKMHRLMYFNSTGRRCKKYKNKYKAINKNIELALIQKPLDEGLTYEEAVKLLDILNDGEVIPIEIQAEYSVAMGFISKVAAERLNYDYENSGLINFVVSILNDTSLENSNNKYLFKDILISLNYK